MKRIKAKANMSAEEFEKRFDDGEDLSGLVEFEKRAINIEFPIPMLENLDRESKRYGVSRTAYIKMILGQELDRIKNKSS